ncbi:MAG: hypothetical protein LBP37_03655 [Spirochaetaceae bacterium]|jgi:hypothetical protein|nr:hypothetical protein [Spirochaetaceae bacterium]
MTNHTTETDKERLAEVVDKLTEENRRCFLGVLEALVFARNERGKTGPERGERPA